MGTGLVWPAGLLEGQCTPVEQLATYKSIITLTDHLWSPSMACLTRKCLKQVMACDKRCVACHDGGANWAGSPCLFHPPAQGQGGGGVNARLFASELRPALFPPDMSFLGSSRTMARHYMQKL